MQPLWKAAWSSLKKLKIGLAYDPATPLLEIWEEIQNINLKNICTPMLIATLFTIVKIWTQPRGPLVDEWICGTFTQWNTMQ